MDTNEYNLYTQLKYFGIRPEILALLPHKPLNIIPIDKDGYIFEASPRDMALWIHNGQEADLVRQIQLLQICQQRGLKGFLYPINLTDERTYAKLDEERWFYLTSWPHLKKVHFSNQEDLRLIVNLLVQFRTTIIESNFLFCLPERRSNNLLQKYQEIIRQLNFFEMLAKYRLKPTAYDRLFLSYLPELIRQANQTTRLLEGSEYRNLSISHTPYNVIMNKLTRHNLRITSEKIAICLRLDDYQWDLPIIDLAILFVKSGRSAKWDLNWYNNILNEYQKYFELSPLELEIIYAYLTFPWSLYRLASRYYYNQVEWPLRTFVAKMERLLADELNRKKLLELIK